MDIFSSALCLWISPGTSGCACGLQKLPKTKDCDIWDWYWLEWRFPCHTWHGWIWRPIFWYRWWRPTSGDPFTVDLQEQMFVPIISEMIILHYWVWRIGFNVWDLGFSLQKFWYNQTHRSIVFGYLFFSPLIFWNIFKLYLGGVSLLSFKFQDSNLKWLKYHVINIASQPPYRK